MRKRNMRIEDRHWEQLERIARAEGKNVSAVIRERIIQTLPPGEDAP